MSLASPIGVIYRKELVDILRDHRTLIAMIVVPIVLYPLLMLGSVQAVSYQKEALEDEDIIAAVIDEVQARSLSRLIEADKAALERERAEKMPPSPTASSSPNAPAAPSDNDPRPIDKIRIIMLGSQEAIEQAIRNRTIHIGVIFDPPALVDDPAVQNKVEWHIDKEDIRSTTAQSRLSEMLARTEERARAKRKAEANLPSAFDDPFLDTLRDHSAPPSVLGQVLPLILILMTITGAIYPAIDITAGERERGTLESLMVCPVSVVHLIVGKFLVVTTVAILGAALNLASVTATVYFGGFSKVVSTTGGSLPLGKMAFILLCLVPFAVLMSAIMIAVCSYARTFKEAQNYVTPIILAVLIPGGIAAMPATRLEGVMLVMPVGNMVLLARDLLLGAAIPLWQIVIVVLSTTFYAGAAVAIAANVFGRESVVFSDVESLKAHFNRAFFRPSDRPSASMSLLYVALLFPLWFFIQAGLSPDIGESAEHLLYATARLMPLLFVVLPAFLAWYWRVSLQGAFLLQLPRVRHVLAAILIGIAAWIPSHLLNSLQDRFIGIPDALKHSTELLAETIAMMSLGMAIFVIAIVPALCEELLFRGFLLSGLLQRGRGWSALLVSAAIFGVFHFFVFKFAVTAGMGVVLAYLCWKSGSIVPSVLAHCLHNTFGVLSVLRPKWLEPLTGQAAAEFSPADLVHEGWLSLPLPTAILGTLVFAIGILLTARKSTQPRGRQLSTTTSAPTPTIAA